MCIVESAVETPLVVYGTAALTWLANYRSIVSFRASYKRVTTSNFLHTCDLFNCFTLLIHVDSGQRTDPCCRNSYFVCPLRIANQSPKYISATNAAARHQLLCTIVIFLRQIHQQYSKLLLDYMERDVETRYLMTGDASSGERSGRSSIHKSGCKRRTWVHLQQWLHYGMQLIYVLDATRLEILNGLLQVVLQVFLTAVPDSNSAAERRKVFNSPAESLCGRATRAWAVNKPTVCSQVFQFYRIVSIIFHENTPRPTVICYANNAGLETNSE